MAATIDAMSSLNLSFDIEAEVSRTIPIYCCLHLQNTQVLDVAMGCLGTASVADLPLVLRFIMQQVNSKSAVEVECTVLRSS